MLLLLIFVSLFEIVSVPVIIDVSFVFEFEWLMLSNCNLDNGNLSFDI